LGVVLLALITFFSLIIPSLSDWGKKMLNFLLPLFVTVICLELFVLNNNISRIAEKDIECQVTQFSEAGKFYEYLDVRLKSAKSLKIVHLSSSPMIHVKNDTYSKILDSYIRKGRLFERVFIATSHAENYKLILDFVEKYKNSSNLQSTIYYVPKERLFINNIPLLSFIIIDDSEVITGFGGEEVTETLPIILVKSPELSATYSTFFDRLVLASNIHSSDENYNKFIDMIKSEEAIQSHN
jgi:hypothetical protein